MKKVAIVGAGNFGYAILKHLDRKKSRFFELVSYDRNKDLVDHLDKTREHPLLHKGIKISKQPKLCKDIPSCVQGADVVILAITSDSTRAVLREMRPHLKKKPIILNTAKALDSKSGKRLSEIVSEELEGIDHSYAMISGGTIAKDLFENEPLGVSIASRSERTLQILQELFESDNLFVYPTRDLTGTEYASAFKNVVSILAGMINGCKFSYGSETHFISRASSEIKRFVTEDLGGKNETFDMGSQCWGNDLWLSCTGKTRNREFGQLLGKGRSTEEALEIMKKGNKTVEGINTLRALRDTLGNDLENFPILEAVYNIVIEGEPAFATLKTVSGAKGSYKRIV